MQLVIIFIIAIVLFVLVGSICYCSNKYMQLTESFEPYKLGYANTKDPYDKPYILKNFLTP